MAFTAGSPSINRLIAVAFGIIFKLNYLFASNHDRNSHGVVVSKRNLVVAAFSRLPCNSRSPRIGTISTQLLPKGRNLQHSTGSFLGKDNAVSLCALYDDKAMDIDTSNSPIEPYIGPIFHGDMSAMQGGIAISELAIQVLVGSSQVVPEQLGLYLALFSDNDHHDGDGDEIVQEVILPKGTALCGYSRGYFTDEYQGDKSVGFLFEGDADNIAVFYEKALITLGDAVRRVLKKCTTSNNFTASERMSVRRRDLLLGHVVTLTQQGSDAAASVYINPDPEFASRVFVPDAIEDIDHSFGPTRLGMYANDLAFDPDHPNEESYLATSDRNNILQIVWRLDLGVAQTQGQDDSFGRSNSNNFHSTMMLVPTWPVVATRTDVRLVNEIPMEVGLQYGFKYWSSFLGNQ